MNSNFDREASSRKQVTFKQLKQWNLSGDGGNWATMLTVTLIGDVPFVGFSRYYRPEKKSEWLPTRKQIFLPLLLWNSFKSHIAEIDHFFQAASLSGMHNFHEALM